MSQNNRWIWVGVIGVTLLLAGYHILQAGQALYTYHKLNRPVSVTFVSWEMEKMGRGRFTARVSYTWRDQSQEELLLAVTSRNTWSVEKLMGPLMEKPWEGWTDSKKTRVVLERFYPWKQITYALVLLGLVIYFTGLHLYLKKFNEGSPKV